jgi:hypothetical protein
LRIAIQHFQRKKPNQTSPRTTNTMFAVKGWKVDASALKPQTKPIKSSKAQDALDFTAARHAEANNDNDNDGPNAEQRAEKANLKRKREEIAAANEPDLGKQWDKHVEGKDVSKPREKKKKDGKKQKRDEKDVSGEEGQTGQGRSCGARWRFKDCVYSGGQTPTSTACSSDES